MTRVRKAPTVSALSRFSTSEELVTTVEAARVIGISRTRLVRDPYPRLLGAVRVIRGTKRSALVWPRGRVERFAAARARHLAKHIDQLRDLELEADLVEGVGLVHRDRDKEQGDEDDPRAVAEQSQPARREKRS